MIVRNVLAVAIIFLFISVSVVPSTGIKILYQFNQQLYTIIHVNGTIGDNEWFISNVTIAFEVECGGNCITYYRLDYGEWEIYDGPFVVCADGYHYIKYYSKDIKNQMIEKIKSADFKIDQTDPTIELTVENIDDNTWLLIADVSDRTSGINKVEFHVDGDYYFTDNEAPFECEYYGCDSYTVYAVVYDNAGNSAERVVVNGPVIKLELSSFPYPPFFDIYIHNIGDVNATNVEWSVRWYGGWILWELFDKTVRVDTGEHPFPLHPGSFLTIRSRKFGYGRVAIIIRAECNEGSSDTLVLEALIAGFLVAIITRLFIISGLHLLSP